MKFVDSNEKAFFLSKFEVRPMKLKLQEMFDNELKLMFLKDM